MDLDNNLKKTILVFQQNEITEHKVYKALSERTKGKNSEILNIISQDELRHYNFWKKFTKKELLPKKIAVFKYLLLSTIFFIFFN